MKKIARIPLLAASLVLLGASASDALAIGPFITSCGRITTPGSYIVTRNLTTSGDCFDVLADHVTIDFAGFVITGDGASGHGLSSSAAGTTVKNGTIASFGVGIHRVSGVPPDVPGMVIERMRVVNNFGFGIGGGTAVVRDSVVTGNGNTGIGLGSGSTVTGTRVVGNLAGINVQQGSVVSGNTVMSNSTCRSLVRAARWSTTSSDREQAQVHEQ